MFQIRPLISKNEYSVNFLFFEIQQLRKLSLAEEVLTMSPESRNITPPDSTLKGKPNLEQFPLPFLFVDKSIGSSDFFNPFRLCVLLSLPWNELSIQ
jgi:hypothetical protein